MHPFNERTVDAGGTQMFVREAGEGSPIVLLHGFPQTGRCWARVAGDLSGSHRIIAPDIPGFGRSRRPRAYDLRTTAETIGSMMDALGVPRAAVVGHDFGGALAFRLALDHPERVDRLTVINSPFRKLDLRHGWHMLFFNVPIVPEAVFAVAGDHAIDFILNAGTVRTDAFGPDALDEYHRAFRSLERRRSAFAYYRTVTRRTILHALPLGRRARSGPPRRIEMPTMIIWGTQDRALPVHLAEGIARAIPQARLEKIEDAGHFVPEEQPERVAALLKEFLS